MLGKTRTSDTSQTGQTFLFTPHPALFPSTSWPKRAQAVWPQWLFQPWSKLWISPSSLIGPYVQSEHCITIWTGSQTSGRTRSWFLTPSRKASTKTSPCHHLLMDQADFILCYELSNQEAFTLHEVIKSMDRQGPPNWPRYQQWKIAMSSHCLDRKEVWFANAQNVTTQPVETQNDFFCSLASPICIDQISNYPLVRVLTYKN